RGFLKGGILFVTINDVNIVYVFLSALFIYFAVFMLLYFLVPNLLSKVKGPLLKLSLILMVLCLLLNDASNGHAHSDQMNISINRPNILLIVMDTMRVDHMSCFGYPKRTTPHIDKYAQDAFIYNKAYSTASWTLP
ncbi:MAG: sulfatase-like hydrolase/transferase, partial [Deltaproteobacteria bacterium]|nr:sulfatase-like hydrolase/transferase [Deltaproteobacteria bacterium]